MRKGQLFQDFQGSGGTGLGFLHRLEPKFVKENFSKLFRGVDVERLTGKVVDVGLHSEKLFTEFL